MPKEAAKKKLTKPTPDTEPAPGINNMSIAGVMNDIAAMLELKGENRFKIQAYRRAADSLLSLPEDVRVAWREGRIKDIPNVGEAIALKIDELLRTGSLGFYERLKAEIPPGLIAVTEIPDVGPKTAMQLYRELGITGLADLEKALDEGRLKTISGFGARSEEKLREGIATVQKRHIDSRILLSTARTLCDQITAFLRGTGVPIDRIEPAGSLRRGKSTIGDVDILCTSPEPEKVINAFATMPMAETIIGQGPNKSSVRLRNGLRVDLMVLSPEQFGSLLHHFTGSREHNIQMRDRAIKRGLKLSEYGFERQDGTHIACATEEEVFATLGLPYIPPEIREGSGEIEAAERGRLPKLVTVADVKGDLHNHSNWSDGSRTIEEMGQAARDRGYEYMAITDHSQSLTIARGLTIERIREQAAEIAEANRKLAPFRILHGVELEIKLDGTLDFPDEILAELDIVVASVHSGLRTDGDKVTERVINALSNPHVDIIAHPTGRILNSREGSALDIEKMIEVARETNTALEINSSPDRLDLDDVPARRAIDSGVMLAVDTDSHSIEGFENIEYGITIARRAWAEPANIINTWPLERLLAWLNRRKS